MTWGLLGCTHQRDPFNESGHAVRVFRRENCPEGRLIDPHRRSPFRPGPTATSRCGPCVARPTERGVKRSLDRAVGASRLRMAGTYRTRWPGGARGDTMPRAPKKCGRLGCEARVTGRTYCPDHAKRPPSPSSIAARDPAESARRARAVASWIKHNGHVCSGYERPAHPSRDLTAAHSTAVARGGKDSALTVLCRSCNSRMWTKST